MMELFHAIPDAESAAVRRHVVARGLEAAVRFRNVSYPEVEQDLRARGGTRAPAVWDGQVLHAGEAACIARLSRLETDR
ncbi:MAG: hypothetical protein FJ086_13680 [Deltaproteobacteria bacterium]|nr:hypothetical protein [Deltaproteobacteria bacterium]